MQLTQNQLRHLRRLAHDLKPVVTSGNAGLTDPVLREIALALEHHELIKVKLRGTDRDTRAVMIERISAETGAAVIQRIGHIAVFYRHNPDAARITVPPR